MLNYRQKTQPFGFMDAINSFSDLSRSWPHDLSTENTSQSPQLSLLNTVPTERNLTLSAEALDGITTKNDLSMPGLDKFILGPISAAIAFAEFISGVIHQDRGKQLQAGKNFITAVGAFIFTVERYSLLFTNFGVGLMAFTIKNLTLIVTGSILCILEGIYQTVKLIKQASFHKTLTFRTLYNLDTSGSQNLENLKEKIKELELLVNSNSDEIKAVFGDQKLDEIQAQLKSLNRLTELAEANKAYVDLAYKIKKEVVARDLSYLLKTHIYPKLPETARENLDIAQRKFQEATESFELAKREASTDQSRIMAAQAALKNAEAQLEKATKEVELKQKENPDKPLRHLASKIEPWLAIEVAQRCSTITVTQNRANAMLSKPNTYHIDKNNNLVRYDGENRWTCIDDRIRVEAAGHLLEQRDQTGHLGYTDVLGNPVINANGELEEEAKKKYKKLAGQDGAFKIVKLSLVERLNLFSPQTTPIDEADTRDAIDQASELMSQVYIKSKQKILIHSLALTCITLTAISLLTAIFIFPPAALIVMSVTSSVVGFARALICQGMLKQRNWTFQLGKEGYLAHWICDVIGAIGKFLRLSPNADATQQIINIGNVAALPIKC